MIACGRIQTKTPKVFRTLRANPKFDDHPVRVGFFRIPIRAAGKDGGPEPQHCCAVSL